MNSLGALRDNFTEAIRDVLWGHIYLTPELEALTKSPPFRRLHRILQLGPVSGIYPGATHTRAAHSLGVYHLARRTIIRLASLGADSWMTAQGALSFLAAALLHDLGHFPYTHSLKELPLRTHEDLTAALILQEPLRSMIGKTGADPQMTAAIVYENKPKTQDSGDRSADPSHGEGELGFYRKLLSGCLDPDKLDYLNRDARYCGVPYGAQDVDYIISRLVPSFERGIDIDSRGIPSVESILFSKYLMYRTVYWLPQVRSATAMIKKAILGGIREGYLSKEEFYCLDDPGLFALLRRDSYPLFQLGEAALNGALFWTAGEFPYDPEKWEASLPIETRFQYEDLIARELSRNSSATIRGGELIIDIPEPIDFETGLFVRDEGKFFPESSSLFKTDIVEGFMKSLRIIRIFIDPRHDNRLELRAKLKKIADDRILKN